MGLSELKRDMTANGKGFYEDLRKFNADNETCIPPYQYFSAKARDEYGIYPEDALMERREEHFLRKFDVKQWDVFRGDRVRQYARDTWAMEKYFSDAGVPLHGPATPAVEKAFTTNTTQGLFPIMFDAALAEGRLQAGLLNRLVAEEVPTNSGLANHIELADPASSSSALAALASNNMHPLQQASEIGEGTRMTQVAILARERQIPLKNFGYEALASYESLRRVRLPVFQRTLARIGRGFQILLTDFLMDVLVLGDGATLLGGAAAPSNAAGTVAAGVAGSPVYADYVSLNLGFPMGYQSVLWIANREAMIKLLNVPEFKDSDLFAYQRDGAMPRPFGHELVRWDTTGGTTAWPNTANNSKILAVDPAIGIIQYTEGGVITESDNIIESRWTRVTSSTWVAFAMMDPQSRLVLTGAA